MVLKVFAKASLVMSLSALLTNPSDPTTTLLGVSMTKNLIFLSEQQTFRNVQGQT